MGKKDRQSLNDKKKKKEFTSKGTTNEESKEFLPQGTAT